MQPLQQDAEFEEQLLAAQRRAELFNRSVLEARQQESSSLKVLEEERRRWTESFEEKNVMIEQLQRELACTVDALSRTPQSPPASNAGFSREYATSYGNRGTGMMDHATLASGLAVAAPAHAAPHSSRQPAASTSSQNTLPAARSHDTDIQFSQTSATYSMPPGLQSTGRDPKAAASRDQYTPEAPANHYQGPSKYSRSAERTDENDMLLENRRLSDLVQDLEETIGKVKNAWRESDTKLHFRTQQVRELEETVRQLEADSFQYDDSARESADKLRSLTSDCSLLEASNRELRLRVHELEENSAALKHNTETRKGESEIALIQLQEKLQLAESNVGILFSRLRTVELEREREKEDMFRRGGDELKSLEQLRLKEKAKNEAQLRRSLDAQELMRMQMTQQNLLTRAEIMSNAPAALQSPPRSGHVSSISTQSPTRPGRDHTPGRGSKQSSFDSLRGDTSPTRHVPVGSYFLREEGTVSPPITSPPAVKTSAPASTTRVAQYSGNYTSDRAVGAESRDRSAWEPIETVTGSALSMSSSAVADAWLEDPDVDDDLIASISDVDDDSNLLDIADDSIHANLGRERSMTGDDDDEMMASEADNQHMHKRIVKKKKKLSSKATPTAASGSKKSSSKTPTSVVSKDPFPRSASVKSASTPRYMSPTAGVVAPSKKPSTLRKKVTPADAGKPSSAVAVSRTTHSATTQKTARYNDASMEVAATPQSVIKPIYIDMRPVRQSVEGANDISLLSLASDKPPLSAKAKKTATESSSTQKKRPEFSISTVKEAEKPTGRPASNKAATAKPGSTSARKATPPATSSANRPRPASAPRPANRRI